MEHRRTCKKLEAKLLYMSKKKATIKQNELLKEVKHVLEKVFSPAQIDLLLQTKKKVTWTEKDISLAFTLRYYSKRCYIFLRNKLNFPLPGLSTLRNWASKISIKSGVLDGVLKILEVGGTVMTSLEKLVVLNFDEVKVAEKCEFDQKRDKVVGPHKQLQIIIARSLCGKWKQPIFADFDTKITQDILNIVMTKLMDIGFRVVACVSDCGPTNTGLWTKLGVSYTNPWIKHPSLDKKVYFFADAPHMIKLVRNWLLDTGFILDGGMKVSKKPLKELIEKRTEISSIFKITKAHLECAGAQRQRVNLAVNLLSHTTSTALLQYKTSDDEYIHLSKFIKTVNDWFDIMNSYTAMPSIKTKSGYGRKDIKEFQDECLDEMFKMVLTMRCVNQKKILKFQEGILLSIKSLQEMYEELKKEFGLSYILTHKLKQDALENLFSQLRTRGGCNDHPTPLDALNRLRIIILGKTVVVQQNTNTIDQSTDEEYLVGKILTRSGISLIEETTNAKKLNGNNSDSSSSLSSKASNTQPQLPITLQMEVDRLQYLAGWIAKKLRSSHSHLGKYTYENNKEHQYNLPNWLNHLSFGGLTEPTDEFMEIIQILDKFFNHYFGDGINNTKNINKKLFKKIYEKRSDIDPIIIKTFIRQRIFIRINYFNEKLQEKKKQYYKKRKSDNCEQLKHAKKMKKIVQ